MKVLERLVQKIGNWQALEELDKISTSVESKFGFPAKRRYQALAGPYAMDTLIIEREWESLAVMEETYTRVLADPEYQVILSSNPGVVVSNQLELYLLL